MKLNYLTILSSLFFIQSCTLHKEKTYNEELFSFYCINYNNPIFDSQIYINDTLFIVKNYGVAHSEKIIVDSTFIVALKGEKIPKSKHYLYLPTIKQMKKIPIDDFIKTECNQKIIQEQTKNSDVGKIIGCDFLDITDDNEKELFIMESSPNYWDSFISHIKVYTKS